LRPITRRMSSSSVAIHWFRNGLRFHDNDCLRDACQQSETLLPLYVIDPDAPFCQTAGLRPGAIRVNFVLEAMKDIDQKLREKNSELIVVVGKHEAVIPEIMTMIGSDTLYYEKDPADPVRKADAKVLKALQKKMEIKMYETHTLQPLEHYLAHCKDHVAPSSYGSFTKIFNKMKVPKEVEDVDQVPPLPTNIADKLKERYGDNFGIPTLEKLGYDSNVIANRGRGGFDFKGGETEGLKQLDKMMARTQWIATFEKPKTSPNNAKCPDTTALSPYVKHGCVSPRRFYHELSKVYAKYNEKNISKPPVSLHGQLMWREYNYLMGYSVPNFDKMIDNPVARQIPWDDDPELVARWKNSQTGYPFIDAIMTQLRETGWIHHLARHAVACFLTRGDLWQSWEEGAAVFEEYLIDADWGINNFNWQWLSCTAHFYQYFRCYSPVAFGKKTDPNGDYIRKWLPQFKDMPAKFIYEPWEAPLALQKKCGVIIGKDYPEPIVSLTHLLNIQGHP
jgi:cryptochrome